MIETVVGPYTLEIATGFGPRITGLRRDEGPQILARLGPEAVIDHPGGTYRFHGGHRLWAAPETPEVTYANDDHGCHVETHAGSVTIAADFDEAGYRKQIEVSADGDWLRVEHTLARARGVRGTAAAWAITQLPLGGLALLPLIGPQTGALPNRRLVIWPYTSLDDPRIRWNSLGVEISGSGQEPLKLGAGPSRPDLGYLREGLLFTKSFVSSSNGDLPDLGAGSQVYVGEGFCELETIGGLSDSEVATVTEGWRVDLCSNVEMAWNLLTSESAS